MSRFLAFLALALTLAGCASEVRQGATTASARPATELAVMQSRLMASSPQLTLRAAVAALHDLGYRFTHIDPRGAVSAIKENRLLVSVLVVPTGMGQVAVRANALMRSNLGPDFTQVDLPEFYRRGIFDPLAAMAGVPAQPIAPGQPLPELFRPIERAPSPLP